MVEKDKWKWAVVSEIRGRWRGFYHPIPAPNSGIAISTPYAPIDKQGSLLAHWGFRMKQEAKVSDSGLRAFRQRRVFKDNGFSIDDVYGIENFGYKINRDEAKP